LILSKIAKRTAGKRLTPKRIIVIGNDWRFRERLETILEREGDLSICSTSGIPAKVMQTMARFKPDLALLDITPAWRRGLELIQRIRGAGHRIKLLVLAARGEASYAARVLRAGADGYILRDEDPEEIVQAICDLLESHVYVSEEVVVNRSKSRREAKGATAKRICALGAELGVEVAGGVGCGASSGGCW
jgi:DNA-binding NarL/FixJ family response regulator